MVPLFSKFIEEAHSYGMEPSVSSYVQGLNDAETRRQKEANALIKKHSLDDEGYKTTLRGDSHRASDPLRGTDVHTVSHGRDIVGVIRQHPAGYEASARGKYGEQFHFEASPKFSTKKKALHFVIASHKEHGR